MRLIERLPRNAGFGSAANVGVAATTGRWVLLLNPDAWPIGDGVEQLVEFAAARPRLGAAGPLLFGAEGEPQRSTIRPPLGPAPLALWAAFPRAVSAAYGVWRRATDAARAGSGVRGRSSCRAPRCCCGGRPSSRWGASTRASSCTARTPTSAPGCARRAGAWSSVPPRGSFTSAAARRAADADADAARAAALVAAPDRQARRGSMRRSALVAGSAAHCEAARRCAPRGRAPAIALLACLRPRRRPARPAGVIAALAAGAPASGGTGGARARAG